MFDHNLTCGFRNDTICVVEDIDAILKDICEGKPSLNQGHTTSHDMINQPKKEVCDTNGNVPVSSSGSFQEDTKKTSFPASQRMVDFQRVRKISKCLTRHNAHDVYPLYNDIMVPVFSLLKL